MALISLYRQPLRAVRGGLEVITRLLRSEEPVSFAGDSTLRDALILPARRAPAGARGHRRQRRAQDLPLAARYADEWNAVYLTADEFAKLDARLDDYWTRPGGRRCGTQDPYDAGRVRPTRADVERKLDGTTRDWVPAGVLVGTEGEIVERLGGLAEAGVQRVMAQWLEVDDIDALEAMAHSVLPQLTAG